MHEQMEINAGEQTFQWNWRNGASLSHAKSSIIRDTVVKHQYRDDFVVRSATFGCFAAVESRQVRVVSP